MTDLLNSVLLNASVAAALALAVWGAGWIPAVRRRPGLRHALWIVVLLKLVTPPLIELSILPTWLVEGLAPVEHPKAIPLESLSAAPATRAGDLGSGLQSAVPNAARFNWPFAAAILCGLGTLTVWTFATWQVWRLRCALRRCATDDARLVAIARRAADSMRLAAAPTIGVVLANVSPLLWVRRSGPLVAIPRRLADRLTDEQLGCVVSHEIAHYLRRDHWTNVLSLLVASACWWNPVVWWARRELRIAQEACCDALVISRSVASRKTYAQTLFQALEFLQAERSLAPALASGFGGKSSTERRFEMIANPQVNHRLSWWSYPVLFAALAALPCLPAFTEAQEVAPATDGAFSIDFDDNGTSKLISFNGTDGVTLISYTAAAPGQTARRQYRVQPSERGLVVLAFDRESKKLAWSSEIELPQRDRVVAGQRFLLHAGSGVVTIAVVERDKSLKIQELDAESGQVMAESQLAGRPGNRFGAEERTRFERQLQAAREQLEKLRALASEVDRGEESEGKTFDDLKELDEKLQRIAEEALNKSGVPERGDEAGTFSFGARPDGETDDARRLPQRDPESFDAISGAYLRLRPKLVGSELFIELSAVRDGHLTDEIAGAVWRLVNGDAPIESVNISNEEGKDRMVIVGKSARHRRIVLESEAESQDVDPDAEGAGQTPPDGASAAPAGADPFVVIAKDHNFIPGAVTDAESPDFSFYLGFVRDAESSDVSAPNDGSLATPAAEKAEE